MEEFAWPIFDHGKIIIGKKTSERRKVQATSFNIFYHHFALIVEVLWTERERKNKKKKQKGGIFYAYVIFNETIKD